MDTILNYDRVVLVKEMNDKFRKVGEVFEVANVFEDSFLLRDGRTRVALGVVSFADFDKHFVHEQNFKGYTPWTPLTGFDGHNDVFYRTNRKKVQLKFLTDKVKAESCCNKTDDFNLATGINIAYLRCRNKACAKRKAVYEAELNAMNRDMADNEQMLKKLINSLDI